MPTLTLSTPIQAHGETVSALQVREPRGKDLRVHGSPFHMVADRQTGEAMPHFDNDACARLLAELAGVPLSSVDQLSAGDFLGAQMMMLGFFGGRTPKPPSSSTSTSEGSGATSLT